LAVSGGGDRETAALNSLQCSDRKTPRSGIKLFKQRLLLFDMPVSQS
jgi:hypothetical protein